ncbi:hypothetical protein ACET3Z_015327 [Daucus carota]
MLLCFEEKKKETVFRLEEKRKPTKEESTKGMKDEKKRHERLSASSDPDLPQGELACERNIEQRKAVSRLAAKIQLLAEGPPSPHLSQPGVSLDSSFSSSSSLSLSGAAVWCNIQLDERECETASGLQLQDAYALCRIFKKSLNAIKVVNHYGIAASDHSSSNIEIYSDGRCEDNVESSDHPMSLSSAYPPNNSMASASTYNNSGTNTHHDAKWMQYLSEEAFSFANPSSFQDAAALSYPPSKVDIALECARLQHRLSLPPLQVQDFPQAGYVDMKTRESRSMYGDTSNQHQDILQEILSVAQVSQELMNQNSWINGNASAAEDDFSFLPQENKIQGQNTNRSMEIGHNEDFGAERMVENLRWVGMSNKDLVKSFHEEYNCVPIENISSFQNNHNLQGESSHQHDFQEVNDTEETDHFSLEFVNDDPNDHGFLNDAELDDFSTSPTFDVYEKIEVTHGLFVSTRQVPDTYFHKIVPSQTVKVHINPMIVHSFPISEVDAAAMPRNISLLDKFKALITTITMVGTTKSLKPWTKTPDPFVGIVSLMITCLYLEDNIDYLIELRDVDDLPDQMKTEQLRNLENYEIFNWEYNEKKCGNVKKEWGSLVLNKVWPCVTLALASYFLGAAHFM